MCKVVPAVSLVLLTALCVHAAEKDASCCKTPASRTALLTSAPRATADNPAPPATAPIPDVAPAPAPAPPAAPPPPTTFQRLLASVRQMFH